MSEATAPVSAPSATPAASQSPASEKVGDANPKADNSKADQPDLAVKEKSEPRPEPRRHKVKVENEDREIPEDELIRGYQTAAAATRRFQEAAKMQKELDAFVSEWQENPKAALKKMAGATPKMRAAVEEWLTEELQTEIMTPEQKAAAERDRKAKEYDEWQKRQGEKREKAELTQMEQHFAQDYDKKFTAALEKVDLPKGPETVQAMIAVMREAVQRGVDLDPADAAQIVMEQKTSALKSIISKMSGEQLLKFFGEETANKLRKVDLARIRAMNPAKMDSAQSPKEQSPRTSQPKRLNSKEFFEAARKRAGV